MPSCLVSILIFGKYRILNGAYAYVMFRKSIRCLQRNSACGDPESFVKGGTSLTTFLGIFFVSWWGDTGSKSHYLGIIVPPVTRHFNGVSLAGRWWPFIECVLGSFVIFPGWSGPVLLRNLFFVFFRGGGPDLCPPLDPRMQGRRRSRVRPYIRNLAT